MKKIFVVLVSLLFSAAVIGATEVSDIIKALPEPVKKQSFGKFARYNFTFDGVGAVLVVPEKAAPGNHWIWRARFFGHQPQTDLALLEKGWFVAYINVGGLFGAPKAVERWNKFYDFLTQKCNLSPRPVLEGMSRGGLIIFNWAKKNPAKVAAIYADAPVCSFQSWPGGKGRGKGAKSAYTQCLAAYGITEKEAAAYNDQPYQQLEALAKAGVPVLAVCGITDDVVPMEENIDIFIKNYRNLGGHIRLIPKPGCWHHPHSLQDPAMIVDFAELYAAGKNQFAKPRKLSSQLQALAVKNSHFLTVKTVNCDKNFSKTFAQLRKLFPGRRLEVTYAADGSCKDPADIYIVESSNKLADAAKLEDTLKNIRKNAPDAPVIVYAPATAEAVKTYMADEVLINESMVTEKRRKYNNTRKAFPVIPQIAAMEKLAEKYSCASVNAALDAAERMRHREFSAEKLPFGAAQTADENIAAMLKK